MALIPTVRRTSSWRILHSQIFHRQYSSLPIPLKEYRYDNNGCKSADIIFFHRRIPVVSSNKRDTDCDKFSSLAFGKKAHAHSCRLHLGKKPQKCMAIDSICTRLSKMSVVADIMKNHENGEERINCDAPWKFKLAKNMKGDRRMSTWKNVNNIGCLRSKATTSINPILRSPDRAALYLPVSFYHTGVSLHSGHNKWSKLKHTKPAADLARSQKIVNYIRKIEVVIREGGSADIKRNKALYALMDNAKKEQVSSEPLLRAIERCANKEYSENALIELVGPGGCCLLVECMVEKSLTGTKMELRRILKKFGGQESPSKFAFDHKGVIYVQKPNQKSFNQDKAEEIAIEAEAEEVSQTVDEEGRDVLEFICDPDSIHEVEKKLKEQEMIVLNASVEFIPHTYRTLSGSQLEAASNLVEKLFSLDFMVNVYHNIEDGDP